MKKQIVRGAYILSFLICSASAMRIHKIAEGGYGPQSFIWIFAISLLCCFLLSFFFLRFANEEGAKNSAQESSVGLISQLEKICTLTDQIRLCPEEITKISSLCLILADSRFFYMNKYGITRFSQFFEPFCHAERYLSRSWSALVDGYEEEAKESFATAREFFQESLTEAAKLHHEVNH